jgi:hypothetical protein
MATWTPPTDAVETSTAWTPPSDAAEAVPTKDEGKGRVFKRYEQSESMIAKMFGKYAPDVLDFTSGLVGTTRAVANLVKPGSVTDSGFSSSLGLPYDADKGSLSSFAGSMVDPVSAAIGGGAYKVAGALPAIGKLGALSPYIKGAIGGGLAGGTTGAISEDGSADTGATFGAMLGAGIPLIGRGIQKGGGALYDLAKGRAGQVKAGQISRAAAGDNLPAIRAAMAAAPSDITAAQAGVGTKQPMWSALGDVAENIDQSGRYYNLGEQQAAKRAGMLTGVTPNKVAAEANLAVGNKLNYGNAATADAARLAQLQTSVRPPTPNVAPSPLGLGITNKVPGVAKNVSTVRGLESLDNLPAFNAAKEEAVRLISNLTDMPAATKSRLIADPTSSVQGLHYIKMAIDNKFKDPKSSSALEKVADSTLTDIKSKLVSAMKLSSPEYNAARLNAIDLYKPVNQANVLDRLGQTLEKSTGGERPAAFTNAVRDSTSLIKKAGGNPRFGGLDEILTPDQMGAVNTVKGELLRDVEVKAQATAGQGGLRDVIDKFTTTFKAPAFMSRTASTVNKALELSEKYLSTATKKALVEGMRSGKTAQEMLDVLPASERNKFLLMMGQADKLSPILAARVGSTQ